MDDVFLRIRIDGAIAEKAIEMAHALDMELPAVIRLLLARAVQTGTFAIDPIHSALPNAQSRAFYAYDDAQWAPLNTVLEGELALALLNQRLASCTIQLEELLDNKAPDAGQIRALRRQRDETRQRLMTLNPSDRAAVQAVLHDFNPQSPPGGASSASGAPGDLVPKGND